ncbi:hypothetical protein BDR03DRAFT_965244 [Suillus americanus]|nr:hypothetical protein BDR03DRAFT_965244 [Suillus americanus]
MARYLQFTSACLLSSRQQLPFLTFAFNFGISSRYCVSPRSGGWKNGMRWGSFFWGALAWPAHDARPIISHAWSLPSLVIRCSESSLHTPHTHILVLFPSRVCLK